MGAAEASLQSKPQSPAAPVVKTSAPASDLGRIKPDWYQKDSSVVITLFIKKLRKDDVQCEYTEKTLSVSIKLHTGADYNLELDLQHTIIPAECVAKVMSTKVEIRLKKKVAIRWTDLEGEGTDGDEGPACTMASAVAMT